MTLFIAETYKIFRRWRTYIGFGAVGAVVILIEVVLKVTGVNFTSDMTRSVQGDFAVFGNVLNGWFITSLIMNSLHIHIPFLITLVAGDIVSSEASSGTVRLLLIRPPSRARIISAKYLTSLFYTAALVIFLGALSLGLGLALFGSGDLITRQVGQFGIVIIPESEIPVKMLLAFLAAVWSMTVIASIAFLFSTLVENSSGPIIGSMAVVIVFFVIGNLPFTFFRTIQPYLFTTYLAFWQDFLVDPVPWGEVAKSATVLGIHNVALFLVAFAVYRRKDIRS